MRGDKMQRQVRYPNYTFLVEAFNDDGERITWFRIDQYTPNPGRESEVTRLTNVVQRHLDSLHSRLGLNYSCFAQGPIGEVDAAIESLGIQLD
jgi:hypothetical protein